MNSHLYGTSSSSALGGREHRGQISEELIRQLKLVSILIDMEGMGGRNVFLQTPHHAAAKSAREGGWKAWTRHSSLNLRGFKVAVFVEMTCAIVTGRISPPSMDTTVHIRQYRIQEEE